MKYILTEKEYDALMNRIDNVTNMYLRDVQQLCIEVAVHKPIKIFGLEDPIITHGCILADDPKQQAEHCNECPCEFTCPNDNKKWSK